MIKIKLVQMPNKANKKNEHPIYIRLTKGSIVKYLSTGYYLPLEQWDPIKEKVKPPYKNSVQLNFTLSKKVLEIQKEYLDNEQFAQLPLDAFLSALKGTNPNSFTSAANKYVGSFYERERISNYRRLSSIVKKIHIYLNKSNIQFTDLTTEVLRNYISYLRNDCGNKQNTIHGNLKVIKKIYKDAIADGLVDAKYDPFVRLKVQTEKTSREYLEESEIEAINALEYPKDSFTQRVRDLFIFACYGGGIRISDILQLKRSSFNGTHITLVTQKTKNKQSILMPEKAKKIILDQLKHKNVYLFGFLPDDFDKLSSEAKHDLLGSKAAQINATLKEIQKDAKLEKNLTFHVSRHTWATMALRKGIRVEYVSKILGHADLKTTMIYTKITNHDLDNIMAKFN